MCGENRVMCADDDGKGSTHFIRRKQGRLQDLQALGISLPNFSGSNGSTPEPYNISITLNHNPSTAANVPKIREESQPVPVYTYESPPRRAPIQPVYPSPWQAGTK